MQERQKREGSPPDLNVGERSAIEEFLTFIEDRVRDIEPVCAELVRMARLALADPDRLRAQDRVLH